jgi:hypothetical protein
MALKPASNVTARQPIYCPNPSEFPMRPKCTSYYMNVALGLDPESDFIPTPADITKAHEALIEYARACINAQRSQIAATRKLARALKAISEQKIPARRK